MSDTPPAQRIVMLGMHDASKNKGGISAVVEVYRSAGLFERWPIVYLGTATSGSPFAKCRVLVTALVRYLFLLASGRVALVHAHTASRASFWRKSIFFLAAFAARRPVILHLHGGRFADFYEECGPLRRRFIRYVLTRADRIVVLSSRWRQRIESIAPSGRIEIVCNPVATNLIELPTEHRSNDTVLFLGRVTASKGIFDLLRAIALVRDVVPNVQLRIGGVGEQAAVLARARQLGIERQVHLLGWIDGEAKRRELQHAAVFVLPSYAEGLPMGVLEAMAAGAPVIATAVGGVPDAISDGVDGFLIQPGAIEELADRIVRLLADAQLRERVAAAARTKAHELFSTEAVLAQIEELYAAAGVRRPIARTSEPRIERPTARVTREV